MPTIVEFTLKYQDTAVVFGIDSSDWVESSSLLASFEPSSSDVSGELSLLAHWISFVFKSKSRNNLLKWAINAFNERIYPLNVHQAVTHLQDREFILNAYYSVYHLNTEYKPFSALLSHPKNSVCAIFGGQGPNEEYLIELQKLHDSYPGILSRLVSISESVLGFPLSTWLAGVEHHPPVEYTSSVTVSFPLIGLTQLAQYLVASHVLKLCPGTFRSFFKGAAGHSQGIVSAIVIAISDSLDSFYQNFEKAIRLLNYIGIRAQEAVPVVHLDPVMVADCAELEGLPSALLSVSGIEHSLLEKLIKQTNQCLDPSIQICISLNNGPKNFVVTGCPKSLYGLVLTLRKSKASPSDDQSKIPFSQRKPVFSVRFLPIYAPFHSNALSSCTRKVLDIDLKGKELWNRSDMAFPVLHTQTGADLRDCENLTESLCEQIFHLPIDWVKATTFSTKPTHFVDFGPGGASGIGPLTGRNLEGTGIHVVIFDKEAELYNSQTFKTQEDWSKVWCPRLVKKSDGSIQIQTALSDLTGKPPIWCCGMTPSTVSGDFVVAVTNSGYAIELAGGGHYNAKMLREKVDYIKNRIEPGHGIILNSLYINQRQWTFQYPLWCQLRREGLPIEGLTVAAGIPSLEVAKEIIQNLKNAQIKYVSFKPGSVEGVRQVVAIAAACPDYPIICQWTGGRAGGHHSYEDFHAPLLAMYSSIRQQKNIVLVVGSGFGSSVETYPYLSGEWSCKYNMPRMPTDGVLLGSRLMTAKECATSLAAKQAIVDAPGVDDQRWEGTYAKETGGILTVRSELGEPIHKIATRGVKLWREFDDKVFSLPKEKRVKWLNENKRYVIDRLNADFQKPWFAKTSSGLVPDSVSEMTYQEVALRMTELMFVKHQSRWIHNSQRDLVGHFLVRVEERFMGLTQKPSLVAEFSKLDKDPYAFLHAFFAEYTQAKDQLLSSEDVEYFYFLCQKPGSKPVPFVAVLDANFEVWFKKDSLWQSEDLDAVVDQDVGRVCILQGPVAVKHSIKVDEPVKEILDNIDKGLIDQLYGEFYQSIPVPNRAKSVADIDMDQFISDYLVVDSNNDKHSIIVNLIPPTSQWYLFLSTIGSCSWLSEFLLSEFIIQDKLFVDNTVKNLLKPKVGLKIELMTGEDCILKIENALSLSLDGNQVKLVMIDSGVPLEFYFHYYPDRDFAPLHEVMDGRNDRIKSFYYRLWFGTDLIQLPSIFDTFITQGTVESSLVNEFCKAVGNLSPSFIKDDLAPMDYAIVLGWKAIIESLFSEEIDGDLLKLVHLTNGFTVLDPKNPLKLGDNVTTQAKVQSVIISDVGKTVKVVGTLIRHDNPVLEVTSEFLFRGNYDDYENTFQTVNEEPMVLEIKTKKSLNVLLSKAWFAWEKPTDSFEGSLIFRLTTLSEFQNKSTTSKMNCSGSVFVLNNTKGEVKVGSVNYQGSFVKGNPVMAYLERHGKKVFNISAIDNEYNIVIDDCISSTFRSPTTNKDYGKISGDSNPIHVNPYFAAMALLPDTITHGMWTSAATRKFLDVVVAENNPSLVLSYNVSFVGMVCPNDELTVSLVHTGMKNGAKVLKVETVNQNGEKVLSGTAEVFQPPTAFVFTGQGSQEQGMGMELYASSEVARSVWDKADAYLQETYSFSIIDIVKNNPKEKTIHFGGLLGQRVRGRYMSMTYDSIDSEGNVKSIALFPDINLSSMKYTFFSPTGLLFSTQFAQIALVVTEKAAFEDMRARGLVNSNVTAFAGHSLGEYAALAAVADFLSINSLCDIVFYRGLTMQRAVERDSLNRSNYAMCAVNPSRIGKSYDEEALKQIVRTVCELSNRLCEIVNFNVENQQYVVAGELVALETLGTVLNFLKLQKIDLNEISKVLSRSEVESELQEIVHGCLKKAQDKMDRDGFIELQRGFATIPLPGIDIPFHSSHIWSGVGPFRSFISRKIDRHHLNVDLLIGKYIPNLTAVPYSLEKSYIQSIFDQTASPRLGKVLESWNADNWSTASKRQQLGYIILVELLAYQFASPVRWIETQDRLFNTMNISRVIEVGPSPVLSGMASRTLKIKYDVQDTAKAIKRQILCVSKNSKEIYYEFEKTEEPTISSLPDPVSHNPVSIAPAAEPVRFTKSVDPIADEPVRALDILIAIIAQKLKKSASELSLSKSIKELVAGKSTLQNEILGDLQNEFSSAPEKGEELPLEELGTVLSSQHNGNLGKQMTSMISRLINQKFPGGFPLSSARSHLTKAWGLGNGRIDSILVRGLTNEPASRLASEMDAKGWLDSTALLYAKESGVSLSQNGGNASGPSSGLAVINSEEFEKFKKAQDEFATQHVELYMRYLGQSSRGGHNMFNEEKSRSLALQKQLDDINDEHGEKYIKGIRSIFNSLKARIYDSSWNWVRQDCFEMWYDVIFGRLQTVDREITAKCIAVINRSDPQIISSIKYKIDSCNIEKGKSYTLAKDFASMLLEACENGLGSSPKCKDVTYNTAPSTTITEKGTIKYNEINRPAVSKLATYVKEMAAGSKVGIKLNVEKIQADVSKLYEIVKQQPQTTKQSMDAIKLLYDEVVRSLHVESHPPNVAADQSHKHLSSSFTSPTVDQPVFLADNALPFLHLKRNLTGSWTYSKQLTSVYLDILTEIATSGSSFENTNALLTGCGRGSIGVEVLKGLLSGGCRVIVTTSSYNKATIEFFQSIYHVFGARGSKLIVVPFNQASKMDCSALIDYIYKDLNMDLDYVVPFAAISENGREIDSIDDLSELAHRLMLTNLIRLLGLIKVKKQNIGVNTRPTQVILPHSPNHGTFGGDGLYAESKVGLEPLFNKWKSESWGRYISLVGAVIGWTRGTGLMNSTNILAEGVEKHGVRTFSSKEMGFNILGLMHPMLASISSVEPLWADLSGGMLLLPQLNDIMEELRKNIVNQADIRSAISHDAALDVEIATGRSEVKSIEQVDLRANFKFEFPKLRDYSDLKEKLRLDHPKHFESSSGKFLDGMIDLDKTVVVVGFAEVGPFGSSRTRWEVEVLGSLSITGCLELARIMGYVKFFNGRLKDGQSYIGWLDLHSGQPITDTEIKLKYEKEILEHTGIRMIEPKLFKGYDPKKKNFTQEIILDHDLEPIETSQEEAAHFKLKHEDFVDIWPADTDSSRWFVKFLRGALLMVPKAIPFDRLVAGQLPTGWDAKRYGLPQDIIDQMDPCGVWSLVATAEALASAGVTDPYELFKYVHVSEVGNALGSGMGGMQSLQGIFKGRYQGENVQKDVLQESFINTTAGWINLLLLSASGPIKIPVGACATSLQSLEIGIDTISSGKAKVMICGGVDDFCEEGSQEFANMKATSNSNSELAQGRSPAEMSRPTTSSRSGFMESQGSGVQILMQARLALEMGAPIYGVLGLTNTAMDKQGRSVPAPGQGILTTAKEVHSKFPSPRLDLAYRRRQLEFRKGQIGEWLRHEHQLLQESVKDATRETDVMLQHRLECLQKEAKRQESEALETWGTGFYKNDPEIAPLRGALAGFGLTIDDVAVVSFHGTSTVANDKNESDVTNKQFSHLGRTKGNSCPVIAQKWLTGHPKGAAAAWMTNGLIQTILSGHVPGNRNADNIAPELQKYEYLYFPSRSIQTDGIKAGILKSFGFGQVGGEALIVHPDYLLSSLDCESYQDYKSKNHDRWKCSYRSLHDAMVHENLIKLKEQAPYVSELESQVLLNPLHRVQKDKKGEYSFSKFEEKVSGDALGLFASSGKALKGVVGIDTELLTSLSLDNDNFLKRNYTLKEISECSAKPDPRSSFTGRWCAKEAVVKAISSFAAKKGTNLPTTQGAGAPLIDIEVLGNHEGAPLVNLSGKTKVICDTLGIENINISISHADTYAVAIAMI